MTTRCCLLLAATAILATLPALHAAPAGSLDPTFGTGGVVETSLGSDSGYGGASGKKIAFLLDGRFWLAGGDYTFTTRSDIVLARFNADGTLDKSFAKNGYVSADFGRYDTCYDMVVQSDGKVVLGGTRDFGPGPVPVAVRFNTDGTSDSTFGTAGKVEVQVSLYDAHCYGIAVQNDGKILMGGDCYPLSNFDFALTRLNSDGTIDSTFGTNGSVITPIGSGNDQACGMIVQPDGKVVIGGSSENGTDFDFAIVRYNADGTLDPTFGSGGKVTTPIGASNDRAQSIAQQADGKIVLAGYSQNGSNNQFAIVRYLTDGTLDASFGTGGKVITAVGDADQVGSIAIQCDGKLLLAGSSLSASIWQLTVLRYNSDGTLDTNFAGPGEARPVISNMSGSAALGVASQSDNQIIVSGYENGEALIVRLHGQSTSDPTPTPTPTPTASPSPTPLTSPLTQTLLTKGQPVPGAGSGGIPAAATWVKLGVPVTNDASDLAFLASTETVTGIFAGPATAPVLIAAKGAKAPDENGLFPDQSPIFSAFKDPLLDENHNVAFLATLTGPGVNSTNNTGLWSNAFTKLKLIARAGDYAVGISAAARWKSFTNVALPGGTIGIVFTAQLVVGPGGVTPANDTGLWTADTAGPYNLILRTGDLIDGKKLQSFKVLSAGPGSRTPAHSYNTVGEIVYKATFTDGTQSIVKVSVP